MHGTFSFRVFEMSKQQTDIIMPSEISKYGQKIFVLFTHIKSGEALPTNKK
jgi:hypothetical protein